MEDIVTSERSSKSMLPVVQSENFEQDDADLQAGQFISIYTVVHISTCKVHVICLPLNFLGAGRKYLQSFNSSHSSSLSGPGGKSMLPVVQSENFEQDDADKFGLRSPEPEYKRPLKLPPIIMPSESRITFLFP
jgi:hypothetical protein